MVARTMLILATSALLLASPAAAVWEFSPENDAGTRADAPDAVEGAPLVEAGKTWSGRLLQPGDLADVYVFEPDAPGLVLRVQPTSPLCLGVFADGVRVENHTCLTAPIQYTMHFELPEAGTYHLRFLREGAFFGLPLDLGDLSEATPSAYYYFSFE